MAPYLQSAVVAAGVTIWLVVWAYRLGHSTGELKGYLEALRIMDQAAAGFRAADAVWIGYDPASPAPTPPDDATMDEETAWRADYAELGREYADGQHAFRRARRASAGVS